MLHSPEVKGTEENDMSPAAPEQRVVRFDAFEFDAQAEELVRAGVKVKLHGQPLHILRMLLEQPGQLVTREQLRQKLWPEGTFVDFEHSLNTAIKKLRRALGDEARKPRLIETLPRRGYRFMGTLAGAAETPAMQRLVPAIAVKQEYVGNVFALRSDTDSQYVLLPINLDILTEKQALEAANDDLGLSLLIASQKILRVAVGITVRVLAVSELPSHYLVRILDAEHIGLTALAPEKYLAKLDDKLRAVGAG
jgi:DNA-binding winged helix-turn-helix (wHTH) protein